MIAELAVFLLIIALLVAVLQSSYLVPAARTHIATLLLPAMWVQALAITLAFALLMLLRVNSDFSVINVIMHSNVSLPLLYKVTGTWGNHEGSMLLWILVLALFGLALAIHPRGENAFKNLAISIQAAICAGFLAFILFTSNPFERQFPPTTDGEALNPLLQDIGLAIHPPLLYLGYVGFSIVYSLAVAALIQGKMDRQWASFVHPWILAAWSSLTLGIALGSWWAYRELGWGGWWFWDPVENASLLPWLAGTALLHSNIVLKKRGLLPQWVALLAIITFALSLLGTFLVRSGALTSVHGFASDPARGLYILGYMTVVTGGALLLYALRAGKFHASDSMLPVSREGVIIVNNLFLLSACATVLLGTTYPLLMEWIENSKLTVGAPYFNATFIPLMMISLVFAGLAPLMPWKQASFKNAFRRATPALVATLAAVLLILAVVKTQLVFALLGFGLATWLAVSSLQWVLQSKGAKGIVPVFISHIGVAFIVAGITGSSLWKEEHELAAAGGDKIEIAGYRLQYKALEPVRAGNHKAQRGEFTVSKSGEMLAVLTPEYRTYDIKNSTTSEAAIYGSWRGDLYTVIGEASADGKHTAARVYYIPMIRFIWLGFVLMALGGIAAIVQQRKTSRE